MERSLFITFDSSPSLELPQRAAFPGVVCFLQKELWGPLADQVSWANDSNLFRYLIL